jgi:hypothetical protein
VLFGVVDHFIPSLGDLFYNEAFNKRMSESSFSASACSDLASNCVVLFAGHSFIAVPVVLALMMASSSLRLGLLLHIHLSCFADMAASPSDGRFMAQLRLSRPAALCRHHGPQDR